MNKFETFEIENDGKLTTYAMFFNKENLDNCFEDYLEDYAGLPSYRSESAFNFLKRQQWIFINSLDNLEQLIDCFKKAEYLSTFKVNYDDEGSEENLEITILRERNGRVYIKSMTKGL